MSDIKMTDEEWTARMTDEEADRLNEEHDKAHLKHRFIEASYTTTVEWDLEEEEIQWDKVEEYWIKYGILNIIYKDGSTSEHYGATGEPDYKWADKVMILNSDWEELDD